MKTAEHRFTSINVSLAENTVITLKQLIAKRMLDDPAKSSLSVSGLIREIVGEYLNRSLTGDNGDVK